jgi:DNA-binding MarR family transcriptional regulator
MVSLVDEMERRGLVYRSRHPDDGRASIVQLSDQGSAQLERLEELNHESTNVLLTALSPEERNHLHDLLTKVYLSHCK